MPEKQRAPFLYAIVNYRFEKEEPKGNPPWLPTFLVIKDRLRLGDEKSEKARDAANARWAKERERKAQEDALHDAKAYADAHASASNNQDAEVELGVGVGVPPCSPPMQGTRQDAPFWVRCLGALTEITGFTYTTMPEKCRLMLERSASTFTVDQVKEMIAYKRDEWNEKDRRSNTSFSKNMTPQTLFSPDHFEQYMHQSQTKAKEENAYAEYD